METGLGGTAGNRCCEKSHPCIALVISQDKVSFPSSQGFGQNWMGGVFLSFFSFLPCMCVCLAIIYCVILKLVNLDMMMYF